MSNQETKSEFTHGWHIFWNSVSEDGFCGWGSTLEEAENVQKVFLVETFITVVSGKIKEAQFSRNEIRKLIKYEIKVLQ